MYDTVKFSYSLFDNTVPKDNEVFNNLVNITESTDLASQSTWIRGNAKNMVIRRNANSITVQGSLPKYQYGNNLQTLQRVDGGLIIDELSDLINTDGTFIDNDKILEKFKSTKCDLNKNLVFSCGSGVTASVLALAYSLIDNKYMPTIYDGSWSEYGKF